jgi:hypothetical protein
LRNEGTRKALALDGGKARREHIHDAEGNGRHDGANGLGCGGVKGVEGRLDEFVGALSEWRFKGVERKLGKAGKDILDGCLSRRVDGGGDVLGRRNRHRANGVANAFDGSGQHGRHCGKCASQRAEWEKTSRFSARNVADETSESLQWLRDERLHGHGNLG